MKHYITALLLIFALGAACTPRPHTPSGNATATQVTHQALFPTETSPPTSTPVPACDEPEGIVLTTTFYSAIQEQEVTYRIYFPPCYTQTRRRYPYVILLHGITYNGKQWLDLGIAGALDRGIKQDNLPPMVVVMPNGGILANVNRFLPGASFEDVIVDELIPALENDSSGYCLWNAREGRVIGGISRGGFWSFVVALRHPEMFSAVSGHSPAFTLEAPNAYNPIHLADTMPRADLAALRIAIDHGTGDEGQNNVPDFIEALERQDVQYTYWVSAGGHDDDYWADHLTKYLAFYGWKWPHNPYLLPDCKE